MKDIRIEEANSYPENPPTKVEFLGMTLRDYFAAKAMPHAPYNAHEHYKCVQWSYDRADAMLKQRDQ